MTSAVGGFTPHSDLEALLAPIGGASPSGEWLFYEAAYDRLREARREEDASLPQGVWQREIKRANWSDVEALAAAALSGRTKDLQIAAWLVEAWVHGQGFGGIRRGMRLMLQLCERFWDDIHPRPDGDDYSARSLIMSWLSDRVATLSQNIPLAQPSGVDLRPWTWAQYQGALERENQQKRGIRVEEPRDAVPMPKMAAAVVATTREFYIMCREDLTDSLEATQELSLLLDERCGADAPSFNRMYSALSTIRDYVDGVLANEHAPPAPEPEPDPMDEWVTDDIAPSAVDQQTEDYMDSQHASPLPPGAVGDHARVRADAYRKLNEAAQTLMRVEPHSPTPYLVLRAIAWGEMSLAELMRHFINSGYDLKSLYAMLGMDGVETQ